MEITAAQLFHYPAKRYRWNDRYCASECLHLGKGSDSSWPKLTFPLTFTARLSLLNNWFLHSPKKYSLPVMFRNGGFPYLENLAIL
jgi:hypothetical protein